MDRQVTAVLGLVRIGISGLAGAFSVSAQAAADAASASGGQSGLQQLLGAAAELLRMPEFLVPVTLAAAVLVLAVWMFLKRRPGLFSGKPAQSAGLPANENPEAPEQQGQETEAPYDRDSRRKRVRDLVADKPISWLLAIAVPTGVFLYLENAGVQRDLAIFIAIAAVTVVMWMSSLMEDFVPALLALLMVLLFGIAPTGVALSGFSSPGFLLAFSILGLGAVVTRSGLSYRYSLLLVRMLPANTFAHQFGVFATGFLFTPIVPTITGRATIVAPVVNNIARGWNRETRARSSTSLYTSGLDGINFLSPIFLTAAPANFMIFGLLPPQEQQEFQFMFWAYAASLTGLIMFLLYFVVLALYFRSFDRVDIPRDYADNELAKMGRMSFQEFTALLAIIMLAVGIVTADLHKISIPYVSFSVLCFLLLIGVLNRDGFVKQIDWAFLFLLGSLIGLLETMRYLGLDRELMAHLSWLGAYMRHDFNSFVLLLTLTILVVRLFIPLNSAIVLFAATLMPLAAETGFSPWLIGFLILIISETAFYGHQSPYILYFRNITRAAVRPEEHRLRVFHGILVLVKLIAIYASMPFWLSLGIL